MISATSGGVWKFPLRVLATEPEVDDIITIESVGLNKESVVGFRMTSQMRWVDCQSQSVSFSYMLSYKCWNSPLLYFALSPTMLNWFILANRGERNAVDTTVKEGKGEYMLYVRDVIYLWYQWNVSTIFDWACSNDEEFETFSQ